MKCRIGIISKHSIKGIPDLNIGEYIGDKQDKKNIQMIYNLHVDLSYMYPFYGTSTVKSRCTEITPVNIKDFVYLQDKYNLTKKIFIPKPVEDRIILFQSPKLYDMSCGVELFDHKIEKPITKYTNASNKNIVYIIPPYKDPVSRGKSIDVCLESYQYHLERSILFIVTGGISYPNTIETWKLSQKYLIKRGVSTNIILNITSDTNDLIKSVIDNVNMLTNKEEDTLIYIAVKGRDMDKYLLQSRKLKNKPYKTFFLNF
jgi:hypothetical protein